jgi:hypothetical protein
MNQTDAKEAAYGIRVSLPANDPFANLLDEDWTTSHWYTSRHERDQALQDMSREHEYSRKGDIPTLVFEAVDRATNS